MRTGTYDAWAAAVIADFDADGVPGVPALRLDGKALTGDYGPGAPLAAAEFTHAVDERIGPGKG